MSATRPPAFDDRFTTPIEASRRGAHRARPKPASATLPVLAGIAVVLLVVGGVYAVVGGSNKSPSSGSNIGAASPGDDDPKATVPANGGATKGSTPKGGGQATGDTANGASAVNRGINLAVLNSVSVQGLALRVKTKLEGKGWTVSRTGNSANKNLPISKIYYAKASQLATAKALIKDLGYGQAVRDATVAKTGLIAVLGQDAADA